MAETYTADVNANDLTYRPCSKDPLKNLNHHIAHFG